MLDRKRRIIGQLALGPSDLKRFPAGDIVERLRLAAKAAKLDALVLWPSGDDALDRRVRSEARALGLELHLWLPALADTHSEPAETELTVNAWGTKGHGSSGCWKSLGSGDEAFLFACPESDSQAEEAVERCQEELAEYDGVFLDRIRYPSPANGLEALFTCFCPRCRERYSQSEIWMRQIHELRKYIQSASDAEVEGWADVADLLGRHGLVEFRLARARSISTLVSVISRNAMDMGKKVGLDLFSPTLARMVGQEYQALGAMADWIKPMSYCRAQGPAGIPLELSCLARGLMAWGKNIGEAAIMAFLRRAYGLPGLPATLAEMESRGIDESAAAVEFARAERHCDCPVYPGFECVRHPDFAFSMSAEGIGRYLAAYADAPGMVLSWNILYMPEDFLRLVAERA